MQLLVKNILKLVLQIINTLVITYFFGCLWYRVAERLHTSDQKTFITNYGLSKKPIDFRLTTSMYFALTTLSTVGYGDYFPVSNLEKVLGSIIMFIGVTFFSMLMSQFLDIINDLSEDVNPNDDNLDKWMLLLRRFNDGSPLDPNLTGLIKRHFEHFWGNNRVASLMENKDYFDSLPKTIRIYLMTKYLYYDIF